MVKLKRDADYKVIYKMDEKLDSIQITLATLCEKVATHDKDINGNGTGGLKRDVIKLKETASSAKGWALGISATVSVAWAMITHFWGRK